MKVHVGISPSKGKLSLYNEAEKSTTFLEIKPVGDKETKKINLMFEEVLHYVDRELGCACICLGMNYGNEIRKAFVNEGLKIGFKRVYIINRGTAVYLNAMSQIKYTPLNGKIIWIKWFITFYVWQINNNKAKFIGRWKGDSSNLKDLEKIVKESKLKKGPDVVLFYDYIDKVNFTKISTCQFFMFNSNIVESMGSLIKARTAAGDHEMSYRNAENYLFKEIIVKLGDKEITAFQSGQNLPIKFSQKIYNKMKIQELEVIAGYGYKECFKLPNTKEFYLTFEIDTNEVHSVNISNESTSTTENIIKSPSLHIPIIVKSKQFIIPKKDTHINTNAIGIDLGTSRCCVAVSRKNGINTVPLDNTGERLLPSYVAYDEENFKCGRIVVNRLRRFSKSTIFDSKRIIGRSFNDIEIDENWQFNVGHDENRVYLEVNGFKGKMKISAEEVAAGLLKYIKQKSEEFQGKQLYSAVITVPAAFTEAQQNATMKASKLKKIILKLSQTLVTQNLAAEILI